MYSVSCQLHTVHTVLFIRYIYVSRKNCLFGKYTLTDVHVYCLFASVCTPVHILGYMCTGEHKLLTLPYLCN